MKKTKKTALCAIMSALGVVILYVGSLFDVLDLTAACVASFLILFLLTELGTGYAFASYAIICVLSFLLLGQKLPALFFCLFFGIMPLTKKWFEHLGTKIGAVLSFILKLLLFNAELVVFGFLAKELLELPDSVVMIVVYIVLCNVMFVLADILYGLSVRIYYAKIRKRISRFLK